MSTPALIVNSQGVPEPPAEMQRRLRQIDPDLHLRFSLAMNQWALAFRWLENDTRREMIRKGAMDPGEDFDIFGYLPMDCGVDEAYGYVVNSLRSWAHMREDAKGMLDRVRRWNEEQGMRNAQPVLEYADELIDANKHTLGREFGVEGIKPVYQSEAQAQGRSNRKRRKGRDL